MWGGNVAVVSSILQGCSPQEHCSILVLSLLLSLEHLVKHLLSPHHGYVSLHLHELKGANSYHQKGSGAQGSQSNPLQSCYP